MRYRERLRAILGVALVFCTTCATYSLYPPCDSDADCEEGSVCVGGECRPMETCSSDEDCSNPAAVCIDGYCRAPECTWDGECAENQKCIDNVCTDCHCQTNADCPLEEFCFGECVCREREVVPCDSDGDCAPDELCIDSTCVPMPACTGDADCPAGLVCENGRCARPCASDEECGTFHLCVDGHCLQQCYSDALCFEPDTICENNLCVPAECILDADCAGEYVRCRSGRCESYTPCETDADCGDPNFVCLANVCEELPTCSFDANCGAEETCIDGHCRPAPACQTEEDCPEDRDCIGGRCLPHACRGPEDCPGSQICVAGECIDPGDPDAVYSVLLLTPGGPIRSGQRVQLVAIALNQAGNEVPGIAFDWDSSQARPAAPRSPPRPGEPAGAAGRSPSPTCSIPGRRACASSRCGPPAGPPLRAPPWCSSGTPAP
jgi:Cys-rich repeat protein